MKICIRRDYIDKTAVNRFPEDVLKEEPYNFFIVEIDNQFADCEFSDFDFIDESYVFSVEKYTRRKLRVNATREIEELKEELVKSDYKAIKFAEGLITENDYLEIKLYRQRIRDRINELEGVL